VGMPKIALKPLDRDIVFGNIIASIALQEAALAHVINADGEKIQAAVHLADPEVRPGTTVTLADVLAVNQTVGTLVSSLTDYENRLREKLGGLLGYVKAQQALPDPVVLTFRNVGPDGENIAGAFWSAAGFVIQLDGTPVHFSQTAVSDAEGNVTLSLPNSATYTLHQVSVPAPYARDENEYTVDVGADAAHSNIDGQPADEFEVVNQI